MKNKLYGRHCIGLARTATKIASIERQVKVLRAYASNEGMIYVGDVRLIGVSANDTEKYIDDLINRKVEDDDFDALLLTNPDRLSRGGVVHGERLLHRLKSAGIEVAFVGETKADADAIAKFLLSFKTERH